MSSHCHSLEDGGAEVFSYCQQPVKYGGAQVFSGALRLDGPTLVNLELLQGSLGGVEGSVLARLDTCVTPGRAPVPHYVCARLTTCAPLTPGSQKLGRYWRCHSRSGSFAPTIAPV